MKGNGLGRCYEGEQKNSAMKASAFLTLFAFLTAGSVLAQPTALPTENQTLRIIQTVEAQFPWMLSQQGTTEGWALIAIAVDARGNLVDCMPVSYSKRAFAKAAIDALRVWRFEPTRVRGEPVGSKVEVMFNFQAVGVVLSFDMSRHLNRLVQEKPEYQPCSLRELDRVPTPIVAPPPAYGKWLVDKGVVGECVVNFYIDETGSVRLPAVVSADFPELGILAVEAIEKWKFEPPTSGNRPVLAKVRQSFSFRP